MFTERLKQIRGNLSYRGFAELLSKYGYSIDAANISKYEKGKVLPGTEFYMAVIRLGYSVNWLLNGIGLMNAEEFVVNDGVIDYHNVAKVPLVETVEAGKLVEYFNGFGASYIRLADVSSLTNPFCYKMQNDDMSPYVLKDDIILCSMDTVNCAESKYCFVVLNNEIGGLRYLSVADDLFVMTTAKGSHRLIKKSDVLHIYKCNKLIRSI